MNHADSLRNQLVPNTRIHGWKEMDPESTLQGWVQTRRERIIHYTIWTDQLMQLEKGVEWGICPDDCDLMTFIQFLQHSGCKQLVLAGDWIEMSNYRTSRQFQLIQFFLDQSKVLQPTHGSSNFDEQWYVIVVASQQLNGDDNTVGYNLQPTSTTVFGTTIARARNPDKVLINGKEVEAFSILGFARDSIVSRTPATDHPGEMVIDTNTSSDQVIASHLSGLSRRKYGLLHSLTYFR